MKQFTTPEQTDKLIELGFKPKAKIKEVRVVHTKVNIDHDCNFTIGELIEFIPDTGDRNFKDRRIFGTAVLYYGREMIYQFDEEPELIDNLFDMIVKLKEYGEI